MFHAFLRKSVKFYFKFEQVLDLSFNEFNGDDFEPLSNLKALQVKIGSQQ
jgi:hypothetical protein